MSEDWTAVAEAITARSVELALSQTLLAKRAGISRTILNEIQGNRTQRKRHQGTLSVLSVSLGWHPNHLDAVLHSEPLPKPTDAVVLDSGDLSRRLSAIERSLHEIKADVVVIKERVQSAD